MSLVKWMVNDFLFALVIPLIQIANQQICKDMADYAFDQSTFI